MTPLASLTMLVLFTFVSVKFSEPVGSFEDTFIRQLYDDSANEEIEEEAKARLYNTAAIRDANFIILRLLTSI